MTGRKPDIAAALVRAIGLWLAWLPIALALLPAVPSGSPGEWLALAAGAVLLGAALTLGGYLWPWVIYVALIAGVAGTAAALGVRWLLSALGLGVAAWLGSRRMARAAVAMAGVAANGVALIAASWLPDLEAYRPLFIVSGLVWFALAAYFTHAKLLDSAGLHDGIVTRLVSRASRRYLMLMVAVVVIVYLATSDFHLWRAIVDYINAHAPKPRPPEASPPQEAPPALPPDWLQDQPSGSKWPKWADYILYGLAGAIGAALLALIIKRYLLHLSWFRELTARLRVFAAKLFRRREPPVQVPYTDEKESLLDIGKALRDVTDRWRRRGARKPLGRRVWEQLAAREKVRRLYQESVLAAVDGGYGHRSSDTPSEALDAAASWYEGREGEGAPSARSRWLRQKRRLLAELYGRARYGSREATPAELEELAGEYPWDSRK